MEVTNKALFFVSEFVFLYEQYLKEYSPGPLLNFVIQINDNHAVDDIKKRLREELIIAGIAIFRSFEYQFVRVELDGSWQKAITKLALDAVVRVIHYHKENFVDFSATTITKGLILGKSKICAHKFCTWYNLNQGYNLKSQNSKWNTSKLFEQAGLVVYENDNFFTTYYKKKGKSNSNKYGYRFPFKWEKIDDQYNQVIPPSEKYIYYSKSIELVSLVSDVIRRINTLEKNHFYADMLFKQEIKIMKKIALENINNLEISIEKNVN